MGFLAASVASSVSTVVLPAPRHSTHASPRLLQDSVETRALSGGRHEATHAPGHVYKAELSLHPKQPCPVFLGAGEEPWRRKQAWTSG